MVRKFDAREIGIRLVKSSTFLLSNPSWIPFGTRAGIRFSLRWESSSLHNDQGGGGGSIVHPSRRGSLTWSPEVLEGWAARLSPSWTSYEVIVCDARLPRGTRMRYFRRWSRNFRERWFDFRPFLACSFNACRYRMIPGNMSEKLKRSEDVKVEKLKIIFF